MISAPRRAEVAKPRAAVRNIFAIEELPHKAAGKGQVQVQDDAIGWSANQRALARCRKQSKVDPARGTPAPTSRCRAGVCVNNNTNDN